MVLGACSGQGPLGYYFLAPGPGPYVISLCYNGAAHSPEGLVGAIQQDCQGAVFLRREGDLTSCSLLLPMRADFRCEKLSNSLATERAPMPLYSPAP